MSAHSAAIIVLSSTVEILLFLGHQHIRAHLPTILGSFFGRLCAAALISIVLSFILVIRPLYALSFFDKMFDRLGIHGY